MRIVVVLQAQTAQEIQEPSRGGAIKSANNDLLELRAAEDELGLSLTPMYPGQSHPTLQPFYFIDVPDQATAEKVISRLTKSAAVEAAYLQPDAELP
jgi:hypothetical protein